MKYHYEYEVRSNNLCWGSLKIGVFRLNGAYSGASVDEGYVCNLWEKKNEEYN